MPPFPPALAAVAVGASLLLPFGLRHYGLRIAPPRFRRRPVRTDFGILGRLPVDAPTTDEADSLAEDAYGSARPFGPTRDAAADALVADVAANAAVSDVVTHPIVSDAVSHAVLDTLADSVVSDVSAGALAPVGLPGSFDVAASHVRSERIVPLTRLPLRRHAKRVAWPLRLEPPCDDSNPERRYRLLVELATAPGADAEPILIAAYREEDATGRAVALRCLKQVRSEATLALFAEALTKGTDEERAIAVDALASNGTRDVLAAALSDRVDAIAARAALAYVGSRNRADYAAALAPFLERARIETLLALLAGYVE
jgi:hypothetical protein